MVRGEQTYSAGEDEPEDEIVAFLEADGVGGFPHGPHEGVGVWVVGVGRHCNVWRVVLILVGL